MPERLGDRVLLKGHGAGHPVIVVDVRQWRARSDPTGSGGQNDAGDGDWVAPVR